MKLLRPLFAAIVALLATYLPASAQGTLPLMLAQQFNFTGCATSALTCGTPLSGGLLYFYQSPNTLIAQNSYSDSGLTMLNPWPLVLDANGRVPPFYLANGSVHVRLTDASGVVQFDYGSMLVVGASGTSSNANIAAGTGVTFTGTNPTTISTRVSGALTLYVDPTFGSDSNACTAILTAACKTIQNAVTLILNNYQFTGTSPNISLANGTYTEQVACTQPVIGAPGLTITGSITNTTWTPPDTLVGLLASGGCNITLTGAHFTSAGAPCAYIDAINGGNITFSAVNFGLINASAGCGEHILVGHGGTVNAVGNYTISGNMTYHVLAVGDSTFEITALQWTMPSALTFSDFFLVSGPANVNFDGTVTCTGTGCGTGSTGAPWNVIYNGSIFVNSSTVPGSYPGVLSLGGCANQTCANSGWALLSTLIATNVATLSDTTHFTSNFNDYVIVLDNVIPVSNAVGLELLIHSGGSFQTSSYVNGTGGVTSYVDLTTATTLGNNGSYGYSGTIKLHNINDTNSYKMVEGSAAFFTGSVVTVPLVGGFWTGGSTAVDGVEFKLTSGNISSGTIRIYGIGLN